MSDKKAEATRNLRYKRPALESMGYEQICNELQEIGEACEMVRWYQDNDEDTLLNALDGDDDYFEFKMAFSGLSASAEQLNEALYANGVIREEYDDCTVALIGKWYRAVGYDSYEEDYYGLLSYEQELARTEAGKRLMRKTKQEIISTIGQCVSVLVAFLNLRQKYDYLKATLDILKDENTSLLNTIREINLVYDEAAKEGFSSWMSCEAVAKLDRLIAAIPDRLWLE